MKKKLVCIACPMGCHLEVAGTPESLQVSGNRCPRGEAYGIEEATSPRRVLTYVVRTNSAQVPFVPVRTDNPLPKALINPLITELNRMRIRIPVRRGQVVLNDYADTGVNVTATRSVSE